jgi:hypothetical protein
LQRLHRWPLPAPGALGFFTQPTALQSEHFRTPLQVSLNVISPQAGHVMPLAMLVVSFSITVSQTER